MAWTAPTQRSTGTLITAAIYNADIIDNLSYLGNSHRHYDAQGAGDGAALPGGLLYATSTDVTLTTSEITVMSYTIAQDALSTNNALRIYGFADMGAASNAHTWRVKLAGTTLLTVTNPGASSDRYHHFLATLRNDDSAAVQRLTGVIICGPASGATGTGVKDNGAGSLALTVTVQLSTGTGAFFHGAIFGYDLPGLPT